jgi:pimeloyl-ACP methyl ester carboxylesterase
MPVVEAPGLKLNAQVLGKGRPLVMLHGLLLGNLASWYLAAGRLAGEDRRIVLYDLRGHGNSEVAPSGYGLEAMAADLEAVLAELAPEGPVDLAGYSYGSLVVLRYAMDHPGRVGRLILVEAPLPPLRELAERYAHADMSTLLASVPPELRKAALASPRRVASATRRIKTLVNDTTLVADVSAEPAFDDEALRALDLPVLCVYGEGSEFLDDARHLERTLPRARLRLIEGSHLLLNENPAGTAAAIKEFLDG